ncbi:hypothetical protein M409DRAFT_69240 [Zasmidium cellare ATCC 36951]|uniref:Formin binding protein n=1 Tax=Zasmidium cellare ATCC 36951 TaxID=1080233 RepID=A0A6A6C5R7_ZASCE|nr:uncharacterized protein M409DRAFT_69240 [Zasmidium cellare ATCC 36951]KAF2162355.1 hypothetical protein M409DRAFT_69240 [Zasmidium cellare ATCC 36951]
MSAWAAAQTADGRTYYWNKTTKETSWEKPADLDVPATPATPATPSGGSAADWSEAKAPDGRSYYYNKITRETRWEIPEELKLQRQQANGHSDFVAGGGRPDFGRQGFGDDRPPRREDRGHGLPQKPSFEGPRDGGGGGRPWESRQESMGFRGPMPAKTDEPEYGSAEAAEEAFFKLLKRHNVTPDTEWNDALRLVVRERDYRAIKDPNERKQAFDKYCQEVRAQEKTREKERKEKTKEEFRQMLTTHEEIKHYTRWKTARPFIEREAVFKSAGDEDEKRRMFDDYILELKKKHVEDEAARRKIAQQELDSMLKVLIIDPDTRWADAEDLIMNNDRFVSDDIFRTLSKVDVFNSFESHMKALERLANDTTQKEKRMGKRLERKARDAFKQLLSEKLKEGKIKAGSKWQDVRPLIAEDERYLGYLGRPGSDALNLFWDLVEDEERKLRSKRNDALDVLEERRWEMTLDTSFDQFVEVMQSHPKTSYLKDDEIGMIFDRLMDKIKKRNEANKADIERQKKDTIDVIRSAMKRVEPPISVEDTYEEVAQRLAGHRDFEAADEDMRKSAYDKYMRRLKERDDHERERARRERDRELDRRNGSRRDDRDRERDRRHRTRTPEVDPYEADRRKAQEVRERQYRKASFGLSPLRRDDRYERDRRPDPRDFYDWERRERERERERNYIDRADPRDKNTNKTLDYGDDDVVGSRPGSIRKRRDSDGSRTRRDRRTRSPEPEGVLKEEAPALQSGSEEGEIEEI